MYKQACFVEKPYSISQIKELKRLFGILEKAKNSKSINAYTDKVLARIRS